jgi:hypothetical protein
MGKYKRPCWEDLREAIAWWRGRPATDSMNEAECFSLDLHGESMLCGN